LSLGHPPQEVGAYPNLDHTPRAQLCNPAREDLTLQLWIDAIEEERSKQ
jgi:hypothetical protein